MRYSSFKQVTTETITNIIRNAPSKSCELDPFPISLIREFATELTLTLTKLVNRSISTGEFSGNLKQVFLRPLFKKIGLSVIFKNYRPVANLSFSSKLIEHVVSQQLIELTKESGIVEPLQSPYRYQHSTETAFLKVKADILHAMDNQKVTCLIMLVLSVVFDTFLHSLLLNRLTFRFGLGGTIIKWLKSYGCTQQVALHNTQIQQC